MDIQVVSSNKTITRSFGRSGSRDISGYWIQYKHLLFEGKSYFVPYDEEDKGDKCFYSVETTQETIVRFNKINETQEDKIEYNEQDETYTIIGKVIFISDDKEIAIVNIADCDFTFDKDEIDVGSLRLMDRVEVTFMGLTLWDEGIY
ncbi:hypothetical protein KB559_07740 [Paenibacillus sp. Marseille-P2973]|uniref:hypothetical protein n=1 Tax=unclassified Paenibacillus TaxID=185978 RepID=UPI001B395AC1|nr:hypothetical protein [Paenibacillus sp. Marseille-P2973]MBQ4898725.1 hypothetical protein [Paenibacillus sp. Marseille-P2973]